MFWRAVDEVLYYSELQYAAECMFTSVGFGVPRALLSEDCFACSYRATWGEGKGVTR